MRILFVAGSFNQGGAEYQLLTLADLMKSKGHEVYVIALTDYDFFKHFLVQRGISFHSLSNDERRITRVWQLKKFIKKFKPDSIITFMPAPIVVTIIARAFSGVKCKLMVSERTAVVDPFLDYLHFSLWRFAEVVTTNSISKVDYFKRNFPLIHKRVHLITNIYGAEVFDPPSESPSLPISSDYNFIFVGRISPEKNLEILIRALAKLKSLGYSFIFNIYGDARHPSYFASINQLIDELSMRESVVIHGPTNPGKLKVIYRNCDLVCLLSLYEGFSNVLAEVLINGSIALASDIAENAYIIKDNENGFLVRNNDIDSVTQGFLRYIKMSEQEKISMRAGNVLRAKILFDRDKFYQNIIGWLNE